MTDHDKILERIIEGLHTIANTGFASDLSLVKIASTAEDILFAFYKAGVSNVAFTSKEKQIICPLICPALQGLGYKLSVLQSSFSSESVDSVRIQRSGLQFFIDTFKDFPASAETLETLKNTLEEFLEREDVEGLDKCLRNAVFDPYSDDSERNASFQAEIKKLPSTHWWFCE